MENIFKAITEYQRQLGYNCETMDDEEVIQTVREVGLALMLEVSEVIESIPWKTWKVERLTENHILDAKEELADCFFFINLLMNTLQIDYQDLKQAILDKLAVNEARLERGYHNKVELKGGDVNGQES